MARSEKRLTESFSAIGADGVRYDVQEWTDIIDTGTLNDPTATTPGMKEYRLASGGHLNKLSDDDFKIVSSGIKVLRVK